MSPQQTVRHQYTIHPSQDYALISAIIRHKKVYPHIADDFSPDPEDYRCPEYPHLVYLLARDRGELLGVWILIPISNVHWEISWAPLPTAFGSRARSATRAVFAWIWANTTCARITATIAATNRLSLLLARAVGMAEYGRNPYSVQRHGRLYGQVLLGISKPA